VEKLPRTSTGGRTAANLNMAARTASRESRPAAELPCISTWRQSGQPRSSDRRRNGGATQPSYQLRPTVRRVVGSLSTTGPGEGVERRMRGVRRSTSAATEGPVRHRHRGATTSSEFALTGYRRRSVNVLWIRLWTGGRSVGTRNEPGLPSVASCRSADHDQRGDGPWQPTGKPSHTTGRADPARSGSGSSVARAGSDLRSLILTEM
jgi:hypothetical protein